MKLNYLLLIFGISLSVFAQKPNPDFSKFDKKGMKTALLLTDGSPFSVLGQENDSYGMYGFSQSYRELAVSDTQKRFKNNDLVLSEMKEVTNNEIISIGFIHTEFETISKNAFDEGKIVLQNNAFIRKSNEYVFQKYKNTIIAPLTLRKVGLKTNFVLDSKMFVNTTSEVIKTIKIDFNDGKGFVVCDFDKVITVDFQSEGKKDLVFQIIFENNTIISRKSSLNVTFSNEDNQRLFRRAPTLVTSTRNPDLAIYGETDLSPGKCEYEVFLSPDGILDKPIFLIDGFDPSDSRNVAAVYQLLNYTDAGGVTQNLGDRIRNQENFDVIIVNFPTYTNAAGNVRDGGADFIERNALSLVNVIELINSQKVGTEQNVVLGPSMGGLITRYALRFMEQNSLNHQTRLWVSIDSPHYGANVSIGLQHLFNYFAFGRANSDAVKPLVNGTLRSPAAKQMLVDHFDAHTTSLVGVTNPTVPTTGLPLLPTGFPNVRNNFQNRMNTIGFPQTTRNIAMINGSGVGALFNDIAGNPIDPGYSLINSNIATGTVSGFNTRAVTNCKFMPNANINFELVKVKIEAQIVLWFTQDTFTARATQSASTNGVDSAPGGLFDILALGGSLGGDPILTNFLSAMRAGYFNFIPAVSGMGLNVGGNIAVNQPNYYHTIALGAKDTPWDGITTPTSNLTPFVNWYMPPTNEPHVKLTNANVNFAWCEIIKPDYNFAINGANTFAACTGNNASFVFNYNNIRGCPQPTTFTTTGVPSGATVSFSPTTIAANGTISMSVSGVSPGTYVINVIPDSNTLKVIPVTITIHPNNPALTGLVEYSVNNSTTFTQGTAVTVTEGDNLELRLPTSLYTGTIEWFDPTNTSRGNTNPTITSIVDNSNDEGIWNASVTFTNNCGVSPVRIPFQVNVQSSLSNAAFEFSGLSIYPNPSSGIITISSKIELINAKTTIIDLWGRIILENDYSIQNSKTIQIDVSNLSQGTYFLNIEKDNLKHTRKILKE